MDGSGSDDRGSTESIVKEANVGWEVSGEVSTLNQMDSVVAWGRKAHDRRQGSGEEQK